MENMPGMNMPASSPSPGSSPQASPEQMNMSMPMASPSPAPTQNSAGGMGNMQMGNTGGGATGNMSGMNMGGMNSMNMGPLMVVSENDMGIRVGSSQTNVIAMGQMGSGTALQASSRPIHIDRQVAGC